MIMDSGKINIFCFCFKFLSQASKKNFFLIKEVYYINLKKGEGRFVERSLEKHLDHKDFF